MKKYRFFVEERFNFADESTVLLGTPTTQTRVLAPAWAVVRDGSMHTRFFISEERMAAPDGRRSIVTREVISPDILGKASELECELQEAP